MYNCRMDVTTVKKIISKLPPDEINTCLWKEETVLHRHSDWEFTSTVDGTGVNIVNGIIYPSIPGNFYLLGPKHVHKQTSDLPIRRRDICVSVERMKKLTDDLSPDLYDELCRQDKPIVIKLSAAAFSELHERLNKADCLDSARSQDAILASLVMFLLGVYVENSSEKFVPKDILAFLQRIQDPNVFSLRINDIIGLSSYSHSHFIKLFKKYVGKTIIEYVTDLRLSYAAKLLANTDMSVITVSTSVGYDNSSFFAQKFRAKFNVSPQEYRNSMRA